MEGDPATAITLETVEDSLRDELAQGDTLLAVATPILRELVASESTVLFSDETVARVRSMLADLAGQMFAAQCGDRTADEQELSTRLIDALADEPALLKHLHALALEGQLAIAVAERCGTDPVLPPLMRELGAADDEGTAAPANAVIAAQARFARQQQRMTLPVGDLPGDLFERGLAAFRKVSEHADIAAERALLEQHGEGEDRTALLADLVVRLGRDAPRALDVRHAGLALFATALSLATGLGREAIILSLADGRGTRTALALCAGGLQPTDLRRQLFFLHPDADLPQGFDDIGAELAASLLVDAGRRR